MKIIRLLIGVLATLVLLTACQSEEQRLKSAEKVAQGFSVAWQNDNYGAAYDYLHPLLQNNRSKEEFIKFVEISQIENKFSLIYDKVVLQDDNLAYAYYTFSGEAIVQPKTPAIEMNYVNGQYRINGFAHYIVDECAESDCFTKLKYGLHDECEKKYPNEVLKKLDCEYDSLLNFKSKCDQSTGYKCALLKLEEVKSEKTVKKVLASPISSSDLADYPNQFIKDGKFIGVLVVGDKAGAEEVISISDIAASLEIDIGDIGATKLALEVSDINSVNSILVGNACTNRAIAEVLGDPSDCLSGQTPGEGRLDLYDVGNENIALIVSGYNVDDIRNAASALSNYKDFNSKLQGPSVTVKKCGDLLKINNC